MPVCPKCSGTEFYADARCKTCSREYIKKWKAQNKSAVKRQKGRAGRKRLLADPAALARRIKTLRSEADYLQSLLS